MAEQLRMFMTPREIVSEYAPLLGDRLKVNQPFTKFEEPEATWERKAQEADKVGLTASIKERGVEIPVSLDPSTDMVVGGHHRIAAALKINPDQFIPVMHHSFPNAAIREEGSIIRRIHFDRYKKGEEHLDHLDIDSHKYDRYGEQK